MPRVPFPLWLPEDRADHHAGGGRALAAGREDDAREHPRPVAALLRVVPARGVLHGDRGQDLAVSAVRHDVEPPAVGRARRDGRGERDLRWGRSHPGIEQSKRIRAGIPVWHHTPPRTKRNKTVSLPVTLDQSNPAGTDSPASGDDVIRAHKLAIEDLFGIPDVTAIAAAGMAWVAAGLETIILQDAAAAPTAEGEIQRNGAALLYHDGTASRTILSTASTVAVANGGTALTSYAVGDLLYASGATTLAKLADVAAGQVLVSGGVGVAPAWSASPTVTGLLVGDGSSGTPAIRFADQTTTGFYRQSNAVTEYVGNGTRTLSLRAGDVALVSGGAFGWTGNSTNPSASLDTILPRDAANTLGMRNGTNGQAINLYETYTSDTTYERLTMDFAANKARIYTADGSAGGQASALQLCVDRTLSWG